MPKSILPYDAEAMMVSAVKLPDASRFETPRLLLVPGPRVSSGGKEWFYRDLVK